jgi:hypothetical protein
VRQLSKQINERFDLEGIMHLLRSTAIFEELAQQESLAPLHRPSTLPCLLIVFLPDPSISFLSAVCLAHNALGLTLTQRSPPDHGVPMHV